MAATMSRLSRPLHYDELIARGKEAYAAKSYDEALRHFGLAMDQAQQRSSQTRIAVLDLQCSTLVKMKRFDDALDAAKSMIRADRQNARGYLRASAMARIQGNISLAVQYLEHGYKHVPQDDLLYANLMAQRSEMKSLATRITTTAKATDPMLVLPLEILQVVLVHLSYREVISMLRVCRSWRKLLNQLEPLTTTVDFRGARRQVSHVALNACVNRLTRPKLIAVEKMLPVTATTMERKLNMWSKWTTLETLYINDSRVVPKYINFDKLNLTSIHIGLETSIFIDQVCHIMSTCHLLRHATFRRVKNSRPAEVPQRESLEVLELGNAFDLSAFPIMPAWFGSFPNLRSLTINGAAASQTTSWDLRKNKKLLKLDTYSCVIRAIHLPSSLEQWLWDGTEVAFFHLSRSLDPAPNPLPNLHTICFSGDNALQALMLMQASQVAPGQLRRIGLHNRQSADALTSNMPMLGMLKDAEEFSFESESLQDIHSAKFMAQYPNIRCLQLAAPRITGAFIADLLRRDGNLISKLVLKDCANISRDTIDWARARGVEVLVHRGAIEVRGGRRMREGWFD